jgi:hypothetical protein
MQKTLTQLEVISTLGKLIFLSFLQQSKEIELGLVPSLDI